MHESCDPTSTEITSFLFYSLQGCIVAQYRLFLKKIGALHDIYFKVNPKYGMKSKSQQNTSSKHLVFTKIVPFSERWRINK